MKLLLAIDDSRCSDAAVRTVVEQFKPDSTEVSVLHVVEWPKGMAPSLTWAEGPSAAEHVLAAHDEARRKGGEILTRAADRLRAAHFSVRGELREGDARDALLDFAADWKPTLIVVGTHGRRGFERFVLGSVSEAVVRRAPCSVQVVRAPDAVKDSP